jgi:chitinase
MHTTGITDYLRSDGSLSEAARKMADHADTRTTQLYDRGGTPLRSMNTARWGFE